jgi:hypothetical protein
MRNRLRVCSGFVPLVENEGGAKRDLSETGVPAIWAKLKGSP